MYQRSTLESQENPMKTTDFNIESLYPALPAGYSWKTVTYVDRNTGKTFLKVSLRREVNILGFIVHTNVLNQEREIQGIDVSVYENLPALCDPIKHLTNDVLRSAFSIR